MAQSSLVFTAVCSAFPASAGVANVFCDVSEVVAVSFFEQPRKNADTNRTATAIHRYCRASESFVCEFMFLPSFSISGKRWLCGLTLPASAATLLSATLLTETLLTWVLLTLTLKGRRMHTGATTIGFGTSLITIATHGRAGPISAERVGAIHVAGRMLNAPVSPDQAVIPVATPVLLTEAVDVIPVIGRKRPALPACSA
jgi:hypothetical protein